jgi:phosphatidylethanolamine/phosphatidyl-N-methylethanolamine N-methyltransferase
VSKKSFIKQFFREFSMVGAMFPSSRFLANKMLNHLPLKQSKVIVELGPGTGVFTERILRDMGKDAHLIVVELNDAFFLQLKQKFQHERCHLVHGSATDIKEILKNLGFDSADLIISSLPLAMIPKEISQKILKESVETLTPGGKYVQYQYSIHSMNALKAQFKQVKLNFTPLNLPPAFIFTCSN